jgi:hypothetical protein
MAVQNPPNLKVSCFNSQAIDPGIKETLIQRFWPPRPPQAPASSQASSIADSVEDFSAYFSFFQGECNLDIKSDYAVKTYDDLLRLLDIIRNNTDVKLSTLHGRVKSSVPGFGTDDKKITASIELIVRLWLMINVRNLMPRAEVEMWTVVPWHDDQSLEQALSTLKDPPKGTRDSEEKTFVDDLNVDNLKKIGGFEKKWTSSLLGHLHVDGKTVYMFHHVTALRKIQDSVPE